MGASPCTLPSRRSCSAAPTLVDAAGLLAIDDPSSCLLLSSFYFLLLQHAHHRCCCGNNRKDLIFFLPAYLPACMHFCFDFFTLPPFLFFYYSHSDISFHSRESWGFSRRPDAVKREQSTRLHCLKRQKTKVRRQRSVLPQ